MTTSELKAQIRAALRQVPEATAKQITKAVGKEKYPSEVVKALSEMRTDAEVECEKKKGKGNEFWYWLVSAENDVALANEGDMPTDKACCNAAKVVATTAGAEVSELRSEIKRLLDQNHSLAVESHEKSQRIADLESSLDTATQVIHRMELEAEQAEEAIDVKDAARGYLVVAPKRKPAKLIKAESAVAKAKATAKVTGRSEVFALVPVGIATRKQIQAVEFNEQNNRGLNHATT